MVRQDLPQRLYSWPIFRLHARQAWLLGGLLASWSWVTPGTGRPSWSPRRWPSRFTGDREIPRHVQGGDSVLMEQGEHDPSPHLLVAHPVALGFLDIPALEGLTGSPVRHSYRSPGEPWSRHADAVIVAPPPTTRSANAPSASATPTPSASSPKSSACPPSLSCPSSTPPSGLAARQSFKHAVAQLRTEGVHVRLGSGEFEPHPPGVGGQQLDTYPWQLVLDVAERWHRAVARRCRAGWGAGVLPNLAALGSRRLRCAPPHGAARAALWLEAPRARRARSGDQVPGSWGGSSPLWQCPASTGTRRGRCASPAATPD